MSRSSRRRNRLPGVLLLTACAGLNASRGQAQPPAGSLEDALSRAGTNRTELLAAIEQSPGARREGMEFLIANMPQRDLASLTAAFLVENVDGAYGVMTEVPWGGKVPKAVFLNDILPYASVNERRDNWRKDFHARFLPLIRDCATPSLAAARLNRKIFAELNVHYSTRRPKADQSPYESVEAGLASCTGLSILLIDACRAVGVPARFVGTPLWADRSGNHSWVEIWDDGWQYTGAAEPSGDQLNRAWFGNRAATALRDHPLHAIYAVSFRRTGLIFPLAWEPDARYVHAVNVTERYAPAHPPAPNAAPSAATP